MTKMTHQLGKNSAAYLSSGELDEQLDILRRIGERGMSLAHKIDSNFVDIFQHLLDEIERTKKANDSNKSRIRS